MSSVHWKTTIVFLAITWVFALHPAYSQEKRNQRLFYETGYNHIGETYMKRGVCDLAPPGNAARSSENLALAEEAFQKAIEANSACIDAHLNLARLYHFKKEFDKAVVEYEQVIDLAPSDMNVLVDMALLQIEMGRKNEAVRYLEQAKRLAGDNRTIQHLDRFIRKSGSADDHSAVKQVNSHPAR